MSDLNQPNMTPTNIVEALMMHPSLIITFPTMEDMPNPELLKDISSIPLTELPAKLAELIAKVKSPAEATATGFEGSDPLYNGTVRDVMLEIARDNSTDPGNFKDHGLADHSHDEHDHDHSHGSGLSGGAIAGIVIGVLAAVIILCAISAKIGRKMQKRSLLNELYNTPSRDLHTTVENLYWTSNLSTDDAQRTPSRYQSVEQDGNKITVIEGLSQSQEMTASSAA